MMTNKVLELAENEKQNLSSYPVKLEVNEDNVNCFVNVKDELFETTETFIAGESSQNNDFNYHAHIKMATHRSSATPEQIDTLLNFLDEHKDLTRGRLKSLEGRVRAKRLWEELCNTLNTMGGCTKTVQQWQKVWFDRKHLAKKAAADSRRSTSVTGGGLATTLQLSHRKIKVLAIIEDGFSYRQRSRVQALSESDDRIPTTSSQTSQPLSFPQSLSLDLPEKNAEPSREDNSQPIQLSEPASQPVSLQISGLSSKRRSKSRQQSAAGSDVMSRLFQYEDERAERETVRNTELAGIRAELSDKNQDQLHVNEVPQERQRELTDVSEMASLKQTKRKEIETNEMNSFEVDLLNSEKSRNSNSNNSVKNSQKNVENDYSLVSSFLCPKCNLFCEVTPVLKDHESENSTHKCHTCSFVLNKKSDIPEQMTTHNENSLKSNQRNKLLINALLSQHKPMTNVRLPKKNRPKQKEIFSCATCLRSFSKRNHLERHVITHSETKKLSCPMCHKTFSRYFHLKTHVRTHTGERPFNCEVCHRSFLCSGHLKNHIRTHTGEKPFKCELCYRLFSTSSGLKNHRLTHTGEKPFKCEVCNKSYSRRYDLKSHIKSHTGERAFNCEVCHKSFLISSYLKSHLRTHSGEKPFKCEICHKSFLISSHLKSHLRTHTGEKPYICNFCHKSFLRKSYLRSHIETHMKDI